MSMSAPRRTRRVVSQLSEAGLITLWMEETELPPPAPGEVTVRMEAAPLHSSDMHKLFGPIDTDRLVQAGSAKVPRLTAPLRDGAMAWQKNRLGLVIAGGSEGVGTVVATGPGAEAWMDQRVALWNVSTYGDHQNVKTAQCLVVSRQVDVADAASAFNNPLTVLCIVETARRLGYRALINTAAASNVGRMLVNVCREEGLGLVSVVRRPAAVQQLQAFGADHVLDSSSADFQGRLVDAIDATGAMVCFDAVGGKLAGDILAGMESSARKRSSEFAPYGSSERRHYFMYGALDPAPMEIPRSAGQSWTCSGWRFREFIRQSSPEDVQRLVSQIGKGLGTTFKGHFSRRIGLLDLLHANVVRECFQRGTDSKTLIAI
ncbi:hypothetical protein [Aquabacterium sp. J223]|uniref:hypothetical protein n=1 Tax=Aquabacterium sp. J223 TaxID=2898431 RepID=UPI0021AE1C6F|nr:hypothetical protein [Aquabacterium sp. J223]UUX95288.1 hypothetical protein LRS07_19050 [Aquabacterium sp. J223]